MSNVSALYHIVFCTKRREMTIPHEHREDLYRYIWAIIKNSNCKLLRIGGIENHVHILLDLHQTVPLATLVRDIKAMSSGWLVSDPRFPHFRGWASEYYAATISQSEKDAVINYIKGQVEHHHGHTFEEELVELHRMAALVLHPDAFIE